MSNKAIEIQKKKSVSFGRKFGQAGILFDLFLYLHRKNKIY